MAELASDSAATAVGRILVVCAYDFFMQITVLP
jgi:hypothetical protein